MITHTRRSLPARPVPKRKRRNWRELAVDFSAGTALMFAGIAAAMILAGELDLAGGAIVALLACALAGLLIAGLA